MFIIKQKILFSFVKPLKTDVLSKVYKRHLEVKLKRSKPV